MTILVHNHVAFFLLLTLLLHDLASCFTHTTRWIVFVTILMDNSSDPIFTGVNGGEKVYGKFLKDYKETEW